MSETLDTIDTFGTPEYFSTHLGAVEDAGDGMLRVIRCVKRGGVLIPVCSLIVPALNVLKEGPRYREMAHKVLHGAMVS
jgi:hypothetical protein